MPRRCVVAGCKSEARANSVYCSDACIVSHARDSLIAMSKEKTKQVQQQQQAEQQAAAAASAPSTPTTPGAAKWKESVEFGQLMSQPTPLKSKSVSQLKKSGSLDKPSNLADDTPVPVMERKTGKILSGSLAPKVVNLEHWLKENPTYEVIKPTSLPKPNRPRLSLPGGAIGTPGSPATPTHSTPSPQLAGKMKTVSSGGRKPVEIIPAHKLQQGNKGVVRKRSIETANSKEDDTPKKVVQVDPESTRASAKSSLRDALWNRVKEADDLRADVDEKAVEQVATDVEEALYRLFKDVGMKYKAKYRSLIFNIKDPKNLGLFRKIVEKQITPGKFLFVF